MASRGAERARRRALVVGSGDVAATFATRLAWGGCDVDRRPAGPASPPVAGLEEAHDAVVIADGTGLEDADLEALDLAAWAAALAPALRRRSLLVLAGGDGRLRGHGAPGGPLGVLEELAPAIEGAGGRVSALLLRETLRDDPRVTVPDRAALAGAIAAEALEYLVSARSAALSGAVLRAPLVRPGPVRRSGSEERRAVREVLSRAPGPTGRPAAAEA